MTKILVERGSAEENQHFLLIRTGEKIAFSAESMDREIGRQDVFAASFSVEEFRRAVAEVKSTGSSTARGVGAYQSANFKRQDNGQIGVYMNQYGGSFWFQEPLETFELKEPD